MCHVTRYDRQNLEFEVEEILTPELQRPPMSYIVKLSGGVIVTTFKRLGYLVSISSLFICNVIYNWPHLLLASTTSTTFKRPTRSNFIWSKMKIIGLLM